MNKNYTLMSEVTQDDYLVFVQSHDHVELSDRLGKRRVYVKIGENHNVSSKKLQPKNFEQESTTVWSFPKRGNWATHKGNFRGNWAPEIARNIILRYSQSGDWVLDQMVGGGTTLVECKLLGRNAIGVDINPQCVMLTRDRLNFPFLDDTCQKTYVGDARKLDKIANETIDLIATHPPYANIIPYSKQRVEGDLSNSYSIDEFIEGMKEVAIESFRVLQPDRYCAILMGDTRIKKHYVPIAFRVLQAFLDSGFILKEDIIKHQWRCTSTPFWREKSIKGNFLLIMHEHLFVFRKPAEGEKTNSLKQSMKRLEESSSTRT